MISAWFRLMRPRQWTKNAFCFAGLVFSGRLSDPAGLRIALLTFAVFCVASSAVYILNDVVDVERDRLHPKKRERPLARGLIPIPAAVVAAIALAAVALAVGALLGQAAWACLAGYLVLNVLYTFRLKHLALLDAAAIALGFVLRLLGGVYAIHELPTAWIALCTLFLALFLGFAKRRSELAELGELSSTSQRPVLAKYTLPFLDSLVNSTATMTVLSYALFTAISGRNPTLVVTVPFVHYGVMRYELLLRGAQGTEEPDTVLLRDRGILLCVLLWLLCYIAIMYGNIHLFREPGALIDGAR